MKEWTTNNRVQLHYVPLHINVGWIPRLSYGLSVIGFYSVSVAASKNPSTELLVLFPLKTLKMHYENAEVVQAVYSQRVQTRSRHSMCCMWHGIKYIDCFHSPRKLKHIIETPHIRTRWVLGHKQLLYRLYPKMALAKSKYLGLVWHTKCLLIYKTLIHMCVVRYQIHKLKTRVIYVYYLFWVHYWVRTRAMWCHVAGSDIFSHFFVPVQKSSETKRELSSCGYINRRSVSCAVRCAHDRP